MYQPFLYYFGLFIYLVSFVAASVISAELIVAALSAVVVVVVRYLERLFQQQQKFHKKFKKL
jgi:hypothetical protein